MRDGTDGPDGVEAFRLTNVGMLKSHIREGRASETRLVNAIKDGAL